VHPELDRILREWWETGFELVFCRRPTLDDFIVPHETIGCHTKSSGYKAWRKSCVEAGVGNISLHSTRNTFITWTRRCGARKEVLERVTHNARGDIVDRYTAWDWRPLCEAVACLRYDTEQLDSRLDQMRLPLGFRAPAPGLEP
jgi:integrase